MKSHPNQQQLCLWVPSQTVLMQVLREAPEVRLVREDGVRVCLEYTVAGFRYRRRTERMDGDGQTSQTDGREHCA